VSRAKRRRTSTRQRSSQPRRGWLPSWRLWIVAGWLGALGAAAYGLNRLEPYVRGINTAPMTIEWVGVPEWLADENWIHILPQLDQRINLDPKSDPYDERVCPYVAERLSGSAWVERVRRVSKQIDGRVKIYADFRKPFTMIEDAGTAYLVDDLGVRLPGEWNAARLNRVGWLVIQGVGLPVPKVGERWGGADLAAGLKLARFLYQAEKDGQMPFRGSIRAIDVRNFAGRINPRAGRLQLVTINPGSYIHWGLPPGEEYGIESSAELKLAMLCRLYAAEGRLPTRGPIDVRADDGIGLGEPD
jgi:hypothetical protein